MSFKKLAKALLGAVIVIPIWIIMRLVNAPRGK